MTGPTPSSNRREFLSGRALRQQVEHAGDVVADSLFEAGEHRPVPTGHDTVRLETSAMACQWAVVMNPGPPRQVMVASDALDIVHRLEDQLTVYRDDSEVMHLNRHAADAPQQVEAGLFDLLGQCRRWSEETGGAFDPTAGPLITLWRDCRANGRIPTAAEVDFALGCVGIQHWECDNQARAIRFRRPGVRFDLGGVGKGFAIDQAVGHLRQEGLSDFLVHGGHSSLYAAGDHAGHGGWPVGIRSPLFTDRRYATLLLCERGMSTSGSNIQYFRHGGRRYGHILDPRTGWPAHSPDVDHDERAAGTSSPAGSLLSVTVLAPTAAQADALSTAFYVMGLEKACEYCHNHPQVSAILIPTPAGGRTLSPVVCNLPEGILFLEESVVSGPLSVETRRGPSPGTSDHGPRTPTP